MVASSNAEAGHECNEHAMPRQLIGILVIEKLKLLKHADHWIQRDITEQQQLELHHMSKHQEMDVDLSEWKALHKLSLLSEAGDDALLRLGGSSTP